MLLNKIIRKSAIITYLLFKVKIPNNDERIHWDFTTLALRKYLKKLSDEPRKILEIGTVPYALLAIFMAKRKRCIISAIDISEAFVENAKKVSTLNKTEINIFQSDLFEKVSGKFDIIFFNEVYIPQAIGIDLGINKVHKNRFEWCGGEDGLETIKRFLHQSLSHLENEGQLILGFNPVYLVQHEVEKWILEMGFKIIKKSGSVFYPSTVYIMKALNAY